MAEEIVYLVGAVLEQFIRNGLPPDLVADALQETLLAIALKFDTCRAESEAGIWQWCYRIARYKIADQWRQTEPQAMSLDLEEVRLAVEVSLRDEAPDAEEAADLAYALELLRAAKPPCVGYLWEAIALDLTYEEMGQLHGKKADAMRMQVERCLALAQKLVGRKVKVNDV